MGAHEGDRDDRSACSQRQADDAGLGSFRPEIGITSRTAFGKDADCFPCSKSVRCGIQCVGGLAAPPFDGNEAEPTYQAAESGTA